MSSSIPPLAEVTTTTTAAKTTTTITVSQPKQTTEQRNIETDKQPLHGILVLSTQNNQEKPTLQIKTREGAIIFSKLEKSPIFTYQTLRVFIVFPSAFHPSNSICNLAKPKKHVLSCRFPSFQSCCFAFLCRFFGQ